MGKGQQDVGRTCIILSFAQFSFSYHLHLYQSESHDTLTISIRPIVPSGRSCMQRLWNGIIAWEKPLESAGRQGLVVPHGRVSKVKH